MVVDNINQKKRRNQLIKTKCADFMLGYNLKCVSTSGSWKKKLRVSITFASKTIFRFPHNDQWKVDVSPIFWITCHFNARLFFLKSRKTYHWTEKIQAFHLRNTQWLYVHFAYTTKFMAVNKLFKLWRKKNSITSICPKKKLTKRKISKYFS